MSAFRRQIPHLTFTFTSHAKIFTPSKSIYVSISNQQFQKTPRPHIQFEVHTKTTLSYGMCFVFEELCVGIDVVPYVHFVYVHIYIEIFSGKTGIFLCKYICWIYIYICWMEIEIPNLFSSKHVIWLRVRITP